ncbi:MAG: small multi-drug export protein [Lentisphaeria bacterium]|nr:small multi-drug export protein [Lentisphaeria bacterium]
MKSIQNIVENASGTEEKLSPWRRFCQLPEFWSLWLGVAAAFGVLAFILVGGQLTPNKGRVFLKVLNYHVLGGAPVGAMQAAKHPILELWENILFNGLITIAIISLFNTFFSLSCRKLFSLSFLEKAFQGLKGDARQQKKTWARFGIPGIFVFVFFPMPFTGPVVGSLLARFVGLRYWGGLGTVIAASLSAIVAWGYAADKVEAYLGGQVLNGILWTLIGITVMAAVVVKVRNWLMARKNPVSVEEDFESGDDQEFLDEEGNAEERH